MHVHMSWGEFWPLLEGVSEKFQVHTRIAWESMHEQGLALAVYAS